VEHNTTYALIIPGIFLGILFRMGLLTFQDGRRAWGKEVRGAPLVPLAGSGAEPQFTTRGSAWGRCELLSGV
jgi:hypothetical protein